MGATKRNHKVFRTEATVLLSHDKHPTLSSVVPVYNDLLDYCLDASLSEETNEEFRSGAEACYKKLQVYNQLTNFSSCVSTVLDPRFNLQYLKNSYRNDLDAEEFKTKLKKLFEVEYFKNIGNKGDNPSPKTLTGLKGMIFKKRKSEPHNEVEEYFNTPTVEDSVCPLTWWRTNEYIFQI
jgi:hypothetical protein